MSIDSCYSNKLARRNNRIGIIAALIDPPQWNLFLLGMTNPLCRIFKSSANPLCLVLKGPAL